MDDYYKTLNISKSATDDEIRKAYKKLAMKHHPDTGGDADTFRQINEAYQALNDPVKRKNYDTYGTTEGQQFTWRTNNSDFNFDDVFSHFGHHFGRGFQQRTPTNRDIRIQYTMELKDIFTGKTEDVTYQLPSGAVEVIRMNIPAGIKTGDKIKFTGYGDDTIKNIPRGDLLVVINVAPDPNFRIDGIDLYTTVKLSIWDLIVGTTHHMNLPDSTTIDLKVPAGTNPGTIFSISNHGLPSTNTGHIGKLFVDIKGFIPRMNDTQLTETRKFVSKLNKSA